jgi:hypothetical protein
LRVTFAGIAFLSREMEAENGQEDAISEFDARVDPVADGRLPFVAMDETCSK